MSIPANDRREKRDGHSGDDPRDSITAAAETLAAYAHNHDPDRALVIPRRLIRYVGDLETAALYSLIAQRILISPWRLHERVEPSEWRVAISNDELADELGVSARKVSRMVNTLRELELIKTQLKQSEAHDWAPTNHYSCNFLREASVLSE